jgi:hypothetical protein
MALLLPSRQPLISADDIRAFATGIDLMIRGLDSYLGQQPDKASASRRRRCATPADGQ